MYKLLFIPIVLFLFGGSSCHKTKRNNIKLLTDEVWIMTSGKLYDSKNVYADLYHDLGECGRDNLYNFKSNGQYLVHENMLKCPQNDSDIVRSGSWAMAEKDNEVLVTTYGHTYKYIIEVLDENNLKWKLEEIDNLIYEYTFVHYTD